MFRNRGWAAPSDGLADWRCLSRRWGQLVRIDALIFTFLEQNCYFYFSFLRFHKKISFKSLLVITIWNYHKQTSKTSFVQVWPTVLDDSWNHPGTLQFRSCSFSSVLIFVVVILVVFTTWLYSIYSIGYNQLQTWSSWFYHTWNGGSSWQCGTLGPGRWNVTKSPNCDCQVIWIYFPFKFA